MTMFVEYSDVVKIILPAICRDRSDAYKDGCAYALGWWLAGRPEPTPERNKDKDNPHPRGSAERDAWLAGWGAGFRYADSVGLKKV